MTLLDACTTFCEAMSTTLGPTLTELLLFALTGALVWWRARVAIRKVETKAEAGIAAANERVTIAKKEAREATVAIAEIKGSLRPSAPSSGMSGNFEPVVMPTLQQGTPSPLPPPSKLPEEFARPTPLPPRRTTP
jgi:hypothetical protein